MSFGFLNSSDISSENKKYKCDFQESREKDSPDKMLKSKG